MSVDPEVRAQRCLDPSCDGVLWLMGPLDEDKEHWGTVEKLEPLSDADGAKYVPCPKCGGKNYLRSESAYHSGSKVFADRFEA